MTIAIACIVAIAVIAWLLLVRPADLPVVEAPSPVAHLVERRTAIYENLRDLQFEYRVGKLSDHDYQQTKRDLQKELAVVLAEMDRIQSGATPAAKPAPLVPPNTCPHCNASFPTPLKFCGECGKPMQEVAK